MTAAAVRWVAHMVAGLSIVGMIVTSITDHVGAAVTFGLVGAVATLCSIVATAVTKDQPAAGRPDEVQAARLEELIQQLVAAGADESEVRKLVGEAVKLGRTTL